MKIAFCIRNDYRTKIGGDTIQCLNTKESLEKHFNLQVEIVSDPNELNNDYDIIQIFNLATAKETKKNFQKAKTLQNPKIVLSPIFWNYKYVAIKDIAKVFGYRIPKNEFQTKISLALIKFLSFLIKKPRIISSHFRNFCKDCVLSSDLLLPNSIEELQELSKFTNLKLDELNKKAQIVPNAAKFSKTFPNDNFFNEFKLPPDFVLQVGRIEFAKNQINLVRALSRHPEIPIVFIGQSNDPIYEKKLKKIAASRGNVHFIENVPNEKIYSFYRKAALHVLPSFRESPGLVSLEALSQECKTVVADKRFTPIDTYFNSYVSVVNPSSINSIRTGIIKELSIDRDMKKIKNDIITKFTWENAAKATYEGYKKII